MNSNQFQRWLTKQGCTFELGKGGHKIVRLGGRKSMVPTHGGRKQLGTGLVNKIKKDLRPEMNATPMIRKRARNGPKKEERKGALPWQTIPTRSRLTTTEPI